MIGYIAFVTSSPAGFHALGKLSLLFGLLTLQFAHNIINLYKNGNSNSLSDWRVTIWT